MTTLAPRTDPLLILADHLDPPLNPHAHDPSRWVRERLGGFLHHQQREIADAVARHRYVAVPSCHDAGKSALAARLACWWLDTHPVGDAFVVSTAPTWKQVRAVLWREIGKVHAAARANSHALPGRTNLDCEWYIGDELVAFGRKPADHDQAAFQGIHAHSVLVIVDEAGGVPRELFDAIDSLATNEHARVLAIGNPDDPSSHFERICRAGSGWHVHHIDGLRTPNFTAAAVAAHPQLEQLMREEDIPPSTETVPDWLRPLLLSPTWVAERIERWGIDSPLFEAKVRGRFPVDADDGVVPHSWVAGCRRPVDRPVDVELVPVELGVDVGGGGDQSVIRERRGPVAGRVWRDRQKDTMRVVGLVIQAIRETAATSVKVDVIGIGKGVHDRLQEHRREGHPALRGVTVHGVNVGESSTQPDRFPLLRDQLWWELGRELSEHQAWDLSALDDDDIAELIAPRYTLDSHGRIKVEPKADTRARLGRSPDDADALLLAYHAPARTDRSVRVYR